MKRIATYYDPRLSGRNDGAPLYFTEVIKNCPGFEVVHFTGEDMDNSKIIRYGKFDAHLWVDWGEDGLRVPYKLIEKLPSLSIYIPCDTHITGEGRDYRFHRADNSDWVFFNQYRGYSEYLKARPERKDRIFWLPCAVEPKAYPNEPKALKKYDIGFVGYVTFRKRAVALDRMFKEFPNFWYGQRLFEDAAEIYRKSKIVFNTAADDDQNMRLWESLSTGSFCLTERVPHLEETFIDGVHLVAYDNMDDAVEKAKYYLTHDAEREKIAKAGMEWVLKTGTYTNRFKEIMLKTGLSDEPYEEWRIKS